jgi:hypothetical protein
LRRTAEHRGHGTKKLQADIEGDFGLTYRRTREGGEQQFLAAAAAARLALCAAAADAPRSRLARGRDRRVASAVTERRRRRGSLMSS